MKYYLFLLLNLSSIVLLSQSNEVVIHQYSVKINWVKNLDGDFSFTNNWEFPLGVETKSDGKAGCADGGFCPERCYNMMDEKGIVLKDSAKIFYQLLDTTHIPFSIESEAWTYEYDGTNIITAIKKQDTVFAFTAGNIATHCSLKLTLINDQCFPIINLVSIMPDNDAVFPYKKGYITIDSTLFKKNILKAEFDFEFDNTFEPDKKMYWKGKIYAPIQLED